MKVFLQDKSFSHCLFSNNPLPPVQFSDDIQWDRSERYTDDDVVIYTDGMIRRSRRNKAKDIAWLVEPRAIQLDNYKFLEQNYTNFYKVFTHDALLLRLPNAAFIPFNGCWISKKDFAIYPKTKDVSIICSNKRFLPEHRMRHECIERFGQSIGVFGNGYRLIGSKLEGLRDYRFHIVIENDRRDFFFTEKLIDCFVTGAIPIYRGCPSIHEFFDMEGIITFSEIEELVEILRFAKEDTYRSRSVGVTTNFQLAQQYLLAESFIFRELKAYGLQ
jgi:hypothetical protein